jgi:hypothetical protein
MAYPKSILSYYGREDAGKKEKLPSRTNNVNPADLINAVRKYIDTGTSNYQNGYMTVSAARAAIRKAGERGINVSNFEEELASLENPAKIRYIEEAISKLEEYQKSKISMREKDAIQLVKSVHEKLKELEDKNVDVSDLRQRFNNIQSSK